MSYVSILFTGRKLFTPLTSLSQRKAASASGIGTTRSKGPLRRCLALSRVHTYVLTSLELSLLLPCFLPSTFSVLQYPSDAQPATSQELCLSLTDRPSVVNSLHYSCELLTAAAIMASSWLLSPYTRSTSVLVSTSCIVILLPPLKLSGRRWAVDKITHFLHCHPNRWRKTLGLCLLWRLSACHECLT